MIIKNKETNFSKDIRQIAGDKQEQDVAFFLRRAFKDNQQVFVFNDFRFEFNEEVAQIDHLILYPYGFVLIESKSITGEVKVNNNQEWTRSYNKHWSGMRSPIKQVELQEKLLLDLLLEDKVQLLPKFLFGLLQQGFAGRCWDHICAISSNAIVHRDDMPKDISKKLVKSEFVVDKVTKLMNIPTSKLITALKAGDTRPLFSAESMDKISNYLMQHHKPSRAEHVQQIIPELSEVKSKPVTKIESSTQTYIVEKPQPPVIPNILQLPQLACKKCNNTVKLQAIWGKFGYYVKCPSCDANTAMKQSCLSCNSKNTKINKKKAYYYLTCQDCNAHDEIFVQSPVISL
ncbi:nuclease-related domain-containing protein [Psychromonas hadalis]|uniref:nuclease-related domain-containing protein n=1 Tax=Psychromonas hadalis TaxID=211669 RepID=UPI0003B4F844|nr:nuclease-related domain-containing protein [Psychromonas hadalis]